MNRTAIFLLRLSALTLMACGSGGETPDRAVPLDDGPSPTSAPATSSTTPTTTPGTTTTVFGFGFDQALLDSPQRVQKAYDAVKALKRVLATEVLGTLGASLKFSDNDGD